MAQKPNFIFTHCIITTITTTTVLYVVWCKVLHDGLCEVTVWSSVVCVSIRAELNICISFCVHTWDYYTPWWVNSRTFLLPHGKLEFSRLCSLLFTLILLISAAVWCGFMIQKNLTPWRYGLKKNEKNSSCVALHFFLFKLICI